MLDQEIRDLRMDIEATNCNMTTIIKELKTIDPKNSDEDAKRYEEVSRKYWNEVTRRDELKFQLEMKMSMVRDGLS